VRAATQRPFAINFFAPTTDPASPGDAAAMLRYLSVWHERFHLPAPELPQTAAESFTATLDTVCELMPAVVSFTFGVLPQEAMRRLKSAGIFVMGTATTTSEAVELERLGVDAVIAQGFEAGGHRGSFATQRATGMVGLMALLPQVADAVRVPVVASGGIMDGRGIVAAKALGAAAVQMGTAFLVTRESGAPRGYKEAVLAAGDESTLLTQAFSGRMARGIENRFMQEMQEAGVDPLAYPWQNALTRGLRKAGVEADRPEVLSLWAGQAAGMSREQSVSELVDSLEREIRDAVRALRN
jgi:nitronate monooxygenase